LAPFLFFFLVSVFGLTCGTYTDFKERMVSNKLTGGMVFLGIAGHTAWAFLSGDVFILFSSVAVTIATFALSYGLYALGAWAGGDVKLFTGLAALNPMNPAVLARLGIVSIAALQPVEVPIFPLTLFVFSLLSMLPYGAFLAIARLLKNKPEKKKFLLGLREKALQALFASGLVAGLGAILQLLGVSQWLALPLFLMASFLPKRAFGILSAAAFAVGLWLNLAGTANVFVPVFSLFIFIYLLFRLYALSKVLMRKQVKVSMLEEGMISAHTIAMKGKRAEIVEGRGIKSLIKYFAQNKSGKETLQGKLGRVIVSGRSAGGLAKEEIKELKRLASENRGPKELTIKESAPFVPAVLIGYLALNIVGDVVWFWLFF